MKKLYAAIFVSTLNLSIGCMQTLDLEMGKTDNELKDARRSPSQEIRSMTEDLERGLEQGWREDMGLRLEVIRTKTDDQYKESIAIHNQLKTVKQAVFCFGAANLAALTIWALTTGINK